MNQSQKHIGHDKAWKGVVSQGFRRSEAPSHLSNQTFELRCLECNRALVRRVTVQQGPPGDLGSLRYRLTDTSTGNVDADSYEFEAQGNALSLLARRSGKDDLSVIGIVSWARQRWRSAESSQS